MSDGAAPGCELAERERNGSGQFVEFCVIQPRQDRLVSGAIGARDEQAMTGGDNAFGDGGNLIRRLSWPKNHLRASLRIARW